MPGEEGRKSDLILGCNELSISVRAKCLWALERILFCCFLPRIDPEIELLIVFSSKQVSIQVWRGNLMFQGTAYPNVDIHQLWTSAHIESSPPYFSVGRGGWTSWSTSASWTYFLWEKIHWVIWFCLGESFGEMSEFWLCFGCSEVEKAQPVSQTWKHCFLFILWYDL